jgi:hypothetical protein
MIAFIYLTAYFDWSRMLCLPSAFLSLLLIYNYQKRLR